MSINSSHLYLIRIRTRLAKAKLVLTIASESGVRLLNVSEIQTDTKRFQNRKEAFSQASVDKIVKDFDANQLDPIVVWREGKKVYVLSGHSRLEAHKILKKKQIPVRFFEGSESEAILYAKSKANRNNTAENLLEDIKAYQLQRDNYHWTKSKFKEEWGEKYNKLEAYSYLNVSGKFLENLNSPAKDSFPYLAIRATWVGYLRRDYPQLTHAHESEMFDYLYFSKYANTISKEVFIPTIQLIVTRIDFDSSKKLNIEKAGKTGSDMRADTAEGQAELRALDKELNEYREQYRVAKTTAEKDALNKLILRSLEDKKRIEQNLKTVLKTQQSLFGVTKYTNEGYDYETPLGKLYDPFKNNTPKGHETFTFLESVKNLNKGISEDDIKAWVYYKQKQGVAMPLWKSYFIKDTKLGNIQVQTYKPEIQRLTETGHLYFHNQEWLPLPVYVYENMYDREIQLIKDKDFIINTYGVEVYERQLLLIQAHKPPVLSVLNPNKNARPNILCFSTFAKGFKIPVMIPTRYGGQEEKITTLFYYFEYLLGNDAFIEKNKDLLVQITAGEVLHYYVKNAGFSKDDSDGYRFRISRYAPLIGEELFARMLHEYLAVEVQQKLDLTWNRIYNGFCSKIYYEKIPLGFPCSKTFKDKVLTLSNTQREGIAFSQLNGSGCLAFDVGVGKTLTAIASLMQNMSNGVCKKPLIIVPDPTYQNWIKELFGYQDGSKYMAGLLSGTGIKVNDWYNLGVDVLKKVDVHKPIEDYTVTIITYSGFEKIGFSQGLMNEYFSSIAQVLSDSDFRSKPQSKRANESQKKKWEEILGTANKKAIVCIRDLGIDNLIVDEAHNFKNVFGYIPTDSDGSKRFKLDEKAGSGRAIRLFFISQYLQEKYGGCLNLLTATPFSNSPIEIYSILGLLSKNDLIKLKCINLYHFLETFVLQTSEFVNNYDGDIVVKPTVRRFNNRIILQKMIRKNILYKTGQEAKIQRPYKINIPKIYHRSPSGELFLLDKSQQIVAYLNKTPQQQSMQMQIEAKAKNVKDLSDVGKVLNLALDNALSPYLITGNPASCTHLEFVENSPKIHYAVLCIKSVRDYHKKRKEPCSGQIIYLNRGKAFFPKIKEYLEKEVGFLTKRELTLPDGRRTTIDEVEILTGETPQPKREAIKEAFQQNICKVIIGTSTIKEGINLQNHCTSIYILYPEWNPTDIKQVEGRGWRQGNRFGYIRVVMPLVQDTMDVFVYQKLSEKTSRINDIWEAGSDMKNALDVEAIDPEEIKFALYTDLKQLTLIELERKKREMDAELTDLQDELEKLKDIESGVMHYQNYKKVVEDSLLSIKMNLHNFDNLAKGNSSWESFSEEKMAEYSERASNQVKEIGAYLGNKEKKDTDLIALINGLKTSIFKTRSIIQVPEYAFEKYKAAFITIEKSKSLFERNRWNFDTNFAEIMHEKGKKLKALNETLQHLLSQENIDREMDFLRLKREKNKVEGRRAEDAIEDFVQFNHLLSYPYEAVKDQEYFRKEIIPVGDYKPGKALNRKQYELPAASDDLHGDSHLHLVRVRMRLAKAKLKLANL